MNILTHEENLIIYDEMLEKKLPEFTEVVGCLIGSEMPSEERCRLMMTSMEEAEKAAVVLLRFLAQIHDQPLPRLLKPVTINQSILHLTLATIYWQAYYLIGFNHLIGITEIGPDEMFHINRMLREVFDERGQSYGSSYQKSPFPFFAMISLLRPRVERVHCEFVEKIHLTYETRESNLVDVCNYAVMGYMELDRQLGVLKDFNKYIVQPFDG